MGLIKGFLDEPLVASSLNQLGPKGQVIAKCLNTTGQPLTLKFSATIGTYTRVKTPQVEEDDPLLWTAGSTRTNGMPAYLEELFQVAQENCAEAGQATRLAILLNRYAIEFNTGNEDIGKTSKVEHLILLKEGTRPIGQLPHQLGLENEVVAEQQVQDLL